MEGVVEIEPSKRALVVAGGGDRGAFAVGALREMRDRGIGAFGVVTGTSTGGLIAPLAALGEIELLERSYLDIEPEDVYTPVAGEGSSFRSSALRALKRGRLSLGDTAPLRRRIEAQLTPERYQRLLELADAGTTRVRITTVNYRTKRVEYVDPLDPRGGGPLPRDAFIDALMATSAVPVYFPPQIGIGDDGDDGGGDAYFDGALRVSAPIDEALRLGAEVLYVVSLAPETPRPRDRKLPSDLVEVALGTIEVLLDDVASEDVRRARDINHATLYLLQLQAYVRTKFGDEAADDLFEGAERLFGLSSPFGGTRAVVMFLIQPSEDYGATLEFGRAKMRRMYDDGRTAARKALDGPGELRALSRLEVIRHAATIAPVAPTGDPTT